MSYQLIFHFFVINAIFYGVFMSIRGTSFFSFDSSILDKSNSDLSNRLSNDSLNDQDPYNLGLDETQRENSEGILGATQSVHVCNGTRVCQSNHCRSDDVLCDAR